jgi:hypothetical protein
MPDEGRHDTCLEPKVHTNSQWCCTSPLQTTTSSAARTYFIEIERKGGIWLGGQGQHHPMNYLRDLQAVSTSVQGSWQGLTPGLVPSQHWLTGRLLCKLLPNTISSPVVLATDNAYHPESVMPGTDH